MVFVLVAFFFNQSTANSFIWIRIFIGRLKLAWNSSKWSYPSQRLSHFYCSRQIIKKSGWQPWKSDKVQPCLCYNETKPVSGLSLVASTQWIYLFIFNIRPFQYCGTWYIASFYNHTGRHWKILHVLTSHPNDSRDNSLATQGTQHKPVSSRSIFLETVKRAAELPHAKGTLLRASHHARRRVQSQLCPSEAGM